MSRLRLALYNACVPAGEHALAVEAIAPLVERLPDNAQLQAALGQELLIVSRKSEAASHIRKALALDPHLAEEPRSLPCVNSYAWVAHHRSRSRATRWRRGIAHAQNVCHAVHFEQPRAIDTLAAAYAEKGQFDEAVHYAQQVVERAVATGDSALVEQAGAGSNSIDQARRIAESRIAPVMAMHERGKSRLLCVKPRRAANACTTPLGMMW